MPTTIRPYSKADLDGVLSSWESAVKVGHPFLPETFLDQERYNIPNVYLPNAETWVAEIAGDVVGFIALMDNEVGAIFVESKRHGSGVGRALMDKAHTLRGDLEVEVFEKNNVGRRFYARYGFVFLEEKIHDDTGNTLLRLKYSSV